MNTQEITTSKKASLLKLLFFMWIKPRSTVRQAVEAMSPLKVCVPLCIASMLAVPLLYYLVVWLFSFSEEKDVILILKTIAFFAHYGFILVPLVFLLLGGLSWYLKLLDGGRRSKASLREIFYANIWVLGCCGMLFNILQYIMIGLMFFKQWDTFFNLYRIASMALLIGVLCIYNACLSEIMKISKLRVLKLILLCFLTILGWLFLFLFPIVCIAK